MKKVVMILTLLGLTLPMLAQSWEEQEQIQRNHDAIGQHEWREKQARELFEQGRQRTISEDVYNRIASMEMDAQTPLGTVVSLMLRFGEDGEVLTFLLREAEIEKRPEAETAVLYMFVKNKDIDESMKIFMQEIYYEVDPYSDDFLAAFAIITREIDKYIGELKTPGNGNGSRVYFQGRTRRPVVTNGER